MSHMLYLELCCCCSASRSCPTSRDSMDCSMPGLPCALLSPGICPSPRTRTIFIYKSKKNRNYVILQNIGQYMCTTVGHIVCSCVSTTQNPELEWERKQENGLLALLGNNSSLCKNLLHPCSMRGRT